MDTTKINNVNNAIKTARSMFIDFATKTRDYTRSVQTKIDLINSELEEFGIVRN